MIPAIVIYVTFTVSLRKISFLFVHTLHVWYDRWHSTHHLRKKASCKNISISLKICTYPWPLESWRRCFLLFFLALLMGNSWFELDKIVLNLQICLLYWIHYSIKIKDWLCYFPDFIRSTDIKLLATFSAVRLCF